MPDGKGKHGVVGLVLASLAAQAAHTPGLPEREEAMSRKAGLGSGHQPCSSQSCNNKKKELPVAKLLGRVGRAYLRATSCWTGLAQRDPQDWGKGQQSQNPRILRPQAFHNPPLMEDMQFLIERSPKLPPL